jgi:6-phosphogluconolactonase
MNPTGGGQAIAYVSSAGSREILPFRLTPDEPGLEPLTPVPVPGGNLPSPTSMPLALGPGHRHLYAAVRCTPFLVASFTIDPGSGGLQPLGTAALPEAMAYIATDRAGRYLLSASYVGASLALSRIGEGGAVEGPALQVIDTPPKAHCILATPSNRHVIATSLGGDVLLRLELDAPAGRLRPDPVPLSRARTGAGPRHFVFSPDGRFLYLLNELDATIDVHAFDAETGGLEARQSVALLPAGFPQPPSAADIHVTPDGHFLYASERASSRIFGFAVEPASGALSLVESVATEPSPRGFAISSDGRFLLAAGQTSHRLSLYSIDPGSGRLTKKLDCPAGSNPNWIELVTLPLAIREPT